jgi:hypothetical protein
MKTALARRNAWMRQLKRLRDERNRRVEDEPEGKFRTARQPADRKPLTASGGRFIK